MINYLRLSMCIVLVSVCALFASECPPPKPESIGVSHTEGKGLGYTQGYTSLDLFLSQPFYQKRAAFFFDLRGHMFNNAKYAANGGFGFRWIDCKCKQIVGINSFYDYLLTSQRPYNQVALGLEWLSKTWGFTLNGYLPVGRKQTPLYQFSYPDLSPNGFLLKGTEKFAMKGVDAELSYQFCNIQCFRFYTRSG
jgi:hypothetical protein